jgi:hypothetical protein
MLMCKKPLRSGFLFLQRTELSWKRRLDERECAFLWLPAQARRRRRLAFCQEKQQRQGAAKMGNRARSAATKTANV